MESCSTAHRVLGLLVIAALSLELYAQQKPYVPPELFDVLPSALEVHASAVGDRLRVPGKEQTVYTGFLESNPGSRIPVRIALQIPGLIRLEGLRPNAGSIIFDGKTPVYTASRIEEWLLEIFSADTTEGMLTGINKGAAVDLVGRRVLAARDGPIEVRYDIFEVSGPLRFRESGRERLKRYFFDSITGLLVKTQYVDDGFSPPVVVEVLFSDWRQQHGSAYPQRIDRRENGHLVFSLTLNSIVALPRQDLTSFVQSPQAGLQEE